MELLWQGCHRFFIDRFNPQVFAEKPQVDKPKKLQVFIMN